VKDSGASEVLYTDNARMILKGFAAEIVHADGADTALGAAETLQSRGAP
jgi:hypothetical protein